MSKVDENMVEQKHIQYYGNAQLYTLIKEANRLQSDNIKINQELIIPSAPSATTGTE